MSDNNIEKDVLTLIDAMAKVGSCTSPSFSPDGRQLAFVSNISGIPQVWMIPTHGGGFPKLITNFEDTILSCSWSPDGKNIAIGAAPGGGMNVQVYLMHPDGSNVRLITQGGKTTNYQPIWSPDGQILSFASNSRNFAAIEGYIYDVQKKTAYLAVENQGIGGIVDFRKDNRAVIVYRMVNRSDSNLYFFNLDSKKEFLLTPHTPPGDFKQGKFSPDGSTIYLSSNASGEFIGFSRIKLESDGKPGPIEILVEKEKEELQIFEITPDGLHAVLVWNRGGKNYVEVVELESMKISKGPVLPAEVVFQISISEDGQLCAMTLTGSTSPNNIYIFNIATKEFWKVTESPHAGVRLSQLIEPELHYFNSFDGLEISGWLYLPHDFQKPGPVVFNYHGGPEEQEIPNFSYRYQALLSQRIAVFTPNVRGSSGFGKTFVNLDNGPLRFNAIKDIKACTDYLVREKIADPKRLGIAGGSYGGYTTMVGITEFPDMFAAAANFFGIVNFETFFKHTEPWMAAISKVQYGDPDTQIDLLRKLSPIHKLDQVKAATLVLHGANDTNCPVVEAEQVVDFLKEKVPVKYVLFPDEGHGFVKTKNKITTAVEIVKWFTQYL